MAQNTGNIILEAIVRKTTGTGATSPLRREGFVPGVVYGEGIKTLPIQVSSKDLTRILHTKGGGNALITLHLKEGDGDKRSPENLVLIKELQHHPVTHRIIHVDFHQVSLTKRITVNVPLAFKGEAVGVKQEGGVLEHIRWNLEVECLPTEIPPEIPVDVSQLAVGQGLDAKAIPLPQGVRLVTDPNMPVVACVIPKAEEAPAPAEAAAEMTEPEVLKQKKPEEIAAEEAQTQAKEKGEKGGKEKEEKKKE